MSLLRLTILSLLVAAVSFGQTAIVEEIIAKVNGDIILRSQLENAISELRREVEANQEATPAQKQELLAQREKNILSDLIDERLLVGKGDELGVSVEADVLRQRDSIMSRGNITDMEEFERWVTQQTGMPIEDLMDRMRQQFMTQAVIGQQVSSRIAVSREEVQAYYDEHKDDFVRSEGVRLAEILISNESATTEAALAEVEKKARDVHARVARGERFDEMARRFSDSEASKEQGGDIGIFRRGVLQKEIEDEVFAGNPGYVTQLMPVSRGWLILKDTDRRREGLADLEEVSEEIRNILIGPRYQPAIREYLASLREDAYIEIRPGYVDANAVEGKDTSWSDPAKLAPVTTTRDELLNKKKKKKLLWLIPLGGGGDQDSSEEPEAIALPTLER
jgi:peptidyl-prolyl cis-trans isomerase SurA